MREASWPVPKTVGLSIVLAGAAILFWQAAPSGFARDSTSAWLLAALGSAAFVAVARLLRLGPAWIVLGAIATPALILVPIYRPPTWIFPAAAVLLAGFFSNGVREKVPLFLSNKRTREAVAAICAAEEARKIVDLGCGLGGVVETAARRCPDAEVIGVETAPLTFLLAWTRIAILGPRNARIEFRSIWESDVSGADLVYAFLSPAPMERLNEKLRAEMKPGSLFISNSFAVPGLEPNDVVAVDDARQTQLLLWRM